MSGDLPETIYERLHSQRASIEQLTRELEQARRVARFLLEYAIMFAEHRRKLEAMGPLEWLTEPEQQEQGEKS